MTKFYIGISLVEFFFVFNWFTLLWVGDGIAYFAIYFYLLLYLL